MFHIATILSSIIKLVLELEEYENYVLSLPVLANFPILLPPAQVVVEELSYVAGNIHAKQEVEEEDLEQLKKSVGVAVSVLNLIRTDLSFCGKSDLGPKLSVVQGKMLLEKLEESQ